MKKIRNVGQMIEMDLGNFGYEGYYAECLYSPSSNTGMYDVRIFLIIKDEDGDPAYLAFVGSELNGKMLYKQQITTNAGTVKNDLYRIISYMCSGASPFIEKFMDEETANG